jgi:hypothetical protein
MQANAPLADERPSRSHRICAVHRKSFPWEKYERSLDQERCACAGLRLRSHSPGD